MRWNSDDLEYGSTRTLSDDLGGHSIAVVTRPGFPGWEAVSPAARLIADHAQIVPGERVLVFPCGHGALGVWAGLSSHGSAVSMWDTNAIACWAAGETAKGANLSHLTVTNALPQPDAADAALVQLSRGRALARLIMLCVSRAVVPGGRVYVAGANRQGIKSVSKDCELLFGPGRVHGFKAGHRVLCFTVPQHSARKGPPAVFAAPGVDPSTYRTIRVDAPGAPGCPMATYDLYTRAGVFSWQHLDPGSALLLKTVSARGAKHILDVGCGYGILGIHLGSQAPDAETTLVDVDWLACASAQRNVERYGPASARVVLGDAIELLAGDAFDLIVSNPPFHTGQAVTVDLARALVHRSYDALERNGRLVLVANRFLAYAATMEQRFGNVRELATTPQYVVLESRRRHHRGSRRALS